MAEAWEDFGAEPAANTAKTVTPSWEDFGAPDASVDPISGGEIRPDKKSKWKKRLDEAQGERPGLDSDNMGILDNKYGPLDVAARGFEYLAAATNTGLDYLDEASVESGLADLPKMVGIDQQILPGAALGALFEAFPAGGLEAGMLPGKMQVGKTKATLAPEIEAGLEQLYKTGTKDQILQYTTDNGIQLGEGLDEFLAHRDAGQLGDTTVRYEPEGGPVQQEMEFGFEPRQREFDFNQPTLEESLTQEAADFRRNRQPDPTPEQLFPPKEEQLSLDVDTPQQESFLFDEPTFESFGSKTEEVAAVNQPHLDKLNAKRLETVDGWANAPEFEIVNSVNDIADPAFRKGVPEGTKAFVGADGKVRIIGENVAEHEIPAITYHEALGHGGMTNLFKSDLDTKLTQIYDSTPWFKNKTDKWLKDNPGAYADSSSRVARAADEVFAKMSEDGVINSGLGKKIYNQIADTIKDYARKAGIKLEYSPREIRSILEMAHSTVTKGETRFYGPTRMYNNNRKIIPRNQSHTADFKTGEPVTVEGVHGTHSGWEQFDPDRRGGLTQTDSAKKAFWFATKDRTANHYAKMATRESNTYKMRYQEKDTPNVLNRHLDLDNPMVIDMKNKVYREESFSSIIDRAQEAGHDGVVIKNAYDAGETGRLDAILSGKLKGETLYAVFDNKKIKDNPNPTNRFYDERRKNERLPFEEEFPADHPIVVDTARELGIATKDIPKALKENDFQRSVNFNRRLLSEGKDPLDNIRFRPLDADEAKRMAKGEDVSRFYSEKNKSLTAEKVRTTEDIDDAMEFLGKNAEYLNEGSVSIRDSFREAAEYGMTPAQYLKSQSLSERKVATRIAGAKQILADQTQGLLDLKKKADKTGLTPSLLMDMQERIATATAVYARFGNDTAEIARSLRLLREVTESRKLGKEMARFMEGEGLDGHLATPESVMRFLSKLEEESAKSPAAAAKVFKSKEVNKVKEAFNNAINLPRAMMSTFDLSAPFRQGVFMVGSKNFWKGIPSMFKQFGSQVHHNFVRDEIMSRPTYPLMEKAGLAITGGGKLAAKEEAFMTNWAEKIPLAGHVVKASERAYTGFLNKLRADTFDSLVRDYEKAGVDLSNPDYSKNLKDIARFTNAATGRGNAGNFAMGPALNGMFFSPRLIASRVSLMNPKFYADLDPVVRKQALKSLISFGTIATTVASMAYMAGAEVETDPRSSDFAKIKQGNTRYDILGGFGQYITLGARLATNEKKKANGDIIELGKGYKADDRVDVAVDFLTNKTSPIASYVIGFMKGKDPTGKPFDLQTEAASRFVPLIIQDTAEIIKEEGIGSAPKALPGVFGVGSNTYDSGPKRKYDEFGSDVEEGTNDPVSAEVEALTEDGKELVTKAPTHIRIAGEKIDLKGDQYDQFQKISGDYFHEQMSAIIQMDGWAEATQEDKRKMIKDLLKESRGYAKEELFGSLEDD